MTKLLAELESEPLTLCLDFRHPQAYLALSPTLALVRELGVGLNVLPCLVAPMLPPGEPGVDDSRGARHRRFRAQYNARDVLRYAAGQGLVIRDLYRQPDPELSALGLLWAGRAGSAVAERYVRAVFAGYWDGSLDLEQRQEVLALLTAAGAAAAGFTDFVEGEGRAELALLQTELKDCGVFAVPTYLVAGERFVGRAHLPLIRRLLSSA